MGWTKTDTFWAGDNIAFDVAFTGGKTGSAAGHGNGGDEQTQILGRVVDRFWSDGISNFQVGMSIASVLYSGNTAGGGTQTLRFRERPEIRVDGTRLIDTGAIAAKTGDMMAFDLEGNWQNFYLEGEWAQFTMDRQCGAHRRRRQCRLHQLHRRDRPSHLLRLDDRRFLDHHRRDQDLYAQRPSPKPRRASARRFRRGPSRWTATAGAPGNWRPATATPTSTGTPRSSPRPPASSPASWAASSASWRWASTGTSTATSA